MRTVDLILRKRQGEELGVEEIQYLVKRYTTGEIPDYQMSALLMAVVWRGLERGELAALTDAMIASGQRLSFEGWATPRIDKHSTGGVGDKTSLILAPLAAACGAACAAEPVIGLITKTETNPFFVKMKEGAQQAARGGVRRAAAERRRGWLRWRGRALARPRTVRCGVRHGA